MVLDGAGGLGGGRLTYIYLGREEGEEGDARVRNVV